MDRVENVFHCVSLYLVAGAAAIIELLSAAVDVHHAVARFPFLRESTRVLSAWSFAPCPWPWDSQDYFRRVLESTLEHALVVLNVGKALDVRVHPVLDLEHDDVLQSLVIPVESRQE